MTKDMTTGSPMKLILRFTLPLLLGNIFQQMYNLIDSVIVGRALGINELSAVGASSSILFLIIGFVNGTCSGFAIPVAQSFGAKNESDVRRYVFNAAILSAGFAVVLTVCTCLHCRNILLWMGTPDEILQHAYEYLFVIFVGIPFTFFYNILAGILRSLGDSRTPFLFLIISTVLNIIGDFFFILFCHMGVMGAALATILAQAVSGVLCFFFLRRRFQILKMQKEERVYDRAKVRKLIAIGVPMGLQFSITAIGSIMLQTAINGLGTTFVAAYAAAVKLKMLALCPFEAIANAMATFGGQNLGAGKLDRIRTGIKDSIFVGILYGILAAVVVHFGGRTMTQMFVDSSNTKVLDLAAQYLNTIGIFFFVLAFLNILRSTIQGLGYSAPAFFAGLFEMVARTIMALAFIPAFGYAAACYTDAAAWVSAALFLIPLFFHVMKKLERGKSMQRSV